MEDPYVAMVAQPAPVAHQASHRVLGLCCLRGAVFRLFEPLEGF